jgi:hypothetical protein
MFNFSKKKEEDPGDLEAVLKSLKVLKSGLNEVQKEIGEIKEKSKANIQKVGMVRYNPFSDVGGEQSFSIALLDEKNDGVIITSHYFKDYGRVYAKSIKGGQSSHALSKEEKKAINRALSSEDIKSK